MASNNKILFIAGEISGDIHGAALISELKKNDNSFSFFGIGGERMKDEGMILIEHINNMAFLGFVEVIKHLPEIRRVKNDILGIVKKENVKTAVLIDYPGFNLNIAKHLKRLGVKIIYYITPQVWAWGKGRVRTIKNLIDKVLVILPFEKEFFKSSGVESVFVGHPLTDRIENYNLMPKEKFFAEYNLHPGKEILVLLPGSREHEVNLIFPEIIKAAKRIADEFSMQIVVAASGNISTKMFSGYRSDYDFKIIHERSYELLKYAKAGIIKSGTSTLEAALMELPMVIVYRTNPLTYFIGKNLVKVKNIGLVNIIAGENIVVELIQNKMNEKSVYKEVKKILTDETYYNYLKNRLSDVRKQLGGRGASQKAAAEIMNVLRND